MTKHRDIKGSDIVKAMKMAEKEFMKPPKKKWWSPTIWKEKAIHGGEVVKGYFFGIKVKF